MKKLIFAVMLLGIALTSNAQARWFNTTSVDISSPDTVASDQQTTLTWTSSDAWAAKIDNGVGKVDLNGSILVSPSETTTYEITVRGGFFGILCRNTGTVTVTVIENIAPVADSKYISTNEDLAIGVLLTGSDSDNDPLTFQIASNPANGSLSGTAPNLIYTPNADFTGVDSFTFVTNDGQVDSAVGTVNIKVVALPLKITILEPVDMSTVSSVVNIYGSFATEAPYTSIRMVSPNRKRGGTLHGNNFYIDNVRLISGDNEITLRAVDSHNNEATTTINVFVEDVPIPTTISIDFDYGVGIVPHDSHLKIILGDLKVLQDSAVVECEGPGEVTITKINDTKFTIHFPIAGMYLLTYSIDDIYGNTHSTIARIPIREPFTEEDYADMIARENVLIELYHSLLETHDSGTASQLVFEAAQNDPALIDVEMSTKGINFSYKNRRGVLLDLPDPNSPPLD